MGASISDPRIPERIRSKIFVCERTGCWLWLGGHSGDDRGGGYGRVSLHGVTVAVHLLIWWLLGGRKLRPKEQLDHTCVTRRCCNPDHQQPLYQSRNIKLANARRRLKERAA